MASARWPRHRSSNLEGMLRTCSRCGPTEAEFPKAGQVCLPCRNASRRAYYTENKATVKAQVKRSYQRNKEKVIARNKGYFLEKKRVVDEAKNKPCMDCGHPYPVVCMDFDHRDGDQKLDCVAILLQRNRTLQVILDEIAKCDVVCSNCHRIRTDRRRKEK